MKIQIALFCVIGCHGLSSMGLAIQQIDKDRHSTARSHDAQDGNGILTELGIATVRAFRYLACPCYMPHKQNTVHNAKRSQGRVTKATKFE